MKNLRLSIAWMSLMPLLVQSAEPQIAGTARSATSGRGKIHYVVAGNSDRTLVFIHGWSGNSTFWSEQAPAVGKKARAIYIDLPGHGQSDKPRTNYTMDFFADSVVAVLRHAGVKKAALVGHSMGVAVICRVHAKAPELVSGLVAVDGFLRRPELTAQQVEQLVGPYRTEAYREHTTKFIHSMFQNPGTEALRDRVAREVLKTPQHVMSSAMEEMFNTGQPDWDLKKVEVPVMAIHARSPRWNADYEAYVKRLSPKSEYRVIEGPGHCLMLEEPAKFNQVFLELLAKHDLIGR